MSTDRVLVLVQSRFGSARLPGKSLRILAGRPMVLHVLDRAASLGYETWLVTSEAPQNDLLALTAGEAGFHVYRGSERDVLRRMTEAAAIAQADVVMRITGDCPLLAPDVAARVLTLYFEHGDGIATNDTNTSGWADGLDVEVFSADLLRRADDVVMRPGYPLPAPDQERLWMHREHVTPWMRLHAPHHILTSSEDWRSVKLSVDCIKDFEFVRRVFSFLEDGAMEWPATRAALLASGVSYGVAQR